MLRTVNGRTLFGAVHRAHCRAHGVRTVHPLFFSFFFFLHVLKKIKKRPHAHAEAGRLAEQGDLGEPESAGADDDEEVLIVADRHASRGGCASGAFSRRLEFAPKSILELF